MKNISNCFYITLMHLLGVSIAFAKSGPPAPTHKTPPPPPGVPINEDVFSILILALILGLYMIYKHNLKTKTSI